MSTRVPKNSAVDRGVKYITDAAISQIQPKICTFCNSGKLSMYRTAGAIFGWPIFSAAVAWFIIFGVFKLTQKDEPIEYSKLSYWSIAISFLVFCAVFAISFYWYGDRKLAKWCIDQGCASE
jgi:hypothetical protein